MMPGDTQVLGDCQLPMINRTIPSFVLRRRRTFFIEDFGHLPPVFRLFGSRFVQLRPSLPRAHETAR